MMLTVQQAQNRILSAVSVLEPEERHILDSLGCVLAQDVYAKENLPPFRNSSMDGFAVLTEDVQLARTDQPVQLSIAEIIPAGYVPRIALKSGQAAKIMTGAMLPKGADSVVDDEMPTNLESSLNKFQSSDLLSKYLGKEYLELYTSTKLGEIEHMSSSFIPKEEYDFYL